jgi:hypothetical protein
MGDRAAGQAMARRVDASHFRGGRLRCFLPAGLGQDVAQGWESGGRVGGRPETRLGCSPRASARGSPLGGARGSTVRMQPSRKREGKPIGGRRGAAFGCSPRASARGSPSGARETRLGCSPRASARGNPVGRGRVRHSWDAALGQGRGEIRWGARGSPGRAPGERRPRAEAAVKRCCGRAGGCLGFSASFSGGGASAGRAHRWHR